MLHELLGIFYYTILALYIISFIYVYNVDISYDDFLLSLFEYHTRVTYFYGAYTLVYYTRLGLIRMYSI